MKKKHILVFSQYFYPENFRINDICVEWVRRGYRVTVVTGIPNYPAGKFFSGYGIFKKRKEKYKGIDIIRIPIIARRKSSLCLIVNYLSFVISGFFWGKFASLEADIVFTYEVSPMTQVLPAVWYAKRKKVRHFLYCMDLWPENVEVMTGISNVNIINLIGKMVDYIYRNVEMIFTSSESFIKNINKRGVQLNKLCFWPQYAEEFYKPLSYKENEIISRKNLINITFAGNIGYAQGLDVLIRTAEILKIKKMNDVKFNIIGDGRYKNDFEKLVIKYKLSSFFCFISKKKPEEIPQYLSNSDLSVVTLKSNLIFNMTIPAKVQSSLACGVPILASADGELTELVKKSKCGLTSSAGNAEELAYNIVLYCSMTEEEKENMKKNALNTSKEVFNKKMLMDRMDTFLEDNDYV